MSTGIRHTRVDLECLAAIVSKNRERLQAPALSLEIHDGSGRLLRSFRSCDEGLSAQAKTLRSRFPIASITKSFVATAILMLRDEGALNLYDDASTFLPELKEGRKSLWRGRTIHHLLSMQGGLPPDYFGSWAEQTMALHPHELSSLLSEELRPAASPGEGYSYSNLGYTVLGRVISSVSRMSFQQFITSRIIQPLELRETSWSATPDRSIGYQFQAGVWIEEPEVVSQCDAAALGGLISSHRDLAKWARFWVGYEDSNGEVFSLQSRAELRSPKVMRPTEEDGNGITNHSAYGYGVSLPALGAEWGVAHGGAAPGFGSYLLWVPKLNWSISGVANLRYAPVFEVCLEVARAALSSATIAAVRPNPEIELVGKALQRLICSWDDSLASELFDTALWKDISREYLREAFARLQDRHNDGRVTIEDGTSGSVIMESGAQVHFHVGPFRPLKIQSVDLPNRDGLGL